MNAEVKRYIDRLFEKHARKMRNIVARGVVSGVDDSHKMQENQIALLDGELIEGAERAQQYGFSSHPRNDAECFVVFAGADRAHPVILSVDDRRYRVQAMAQGEVCIYTDEGDKIHLGRDNTITVTTKHAIVNAEEDATVNTKKAEVNAEDEWTVNTTTATINASAHIGLNTPSLSARPGGGGAMQADFVMDVVHRGEWRQDGGHVSTGDQVAGGVSQINHVHSGVRSGGDTTDKPVGGGG